MKKRSIIPVVFFAASMFTSADVNMAAYKKAVKSEAVTTVVAKYVAENPEDVVTLVKEAIIQTEASAEDVAKIVKAAIEAAPEKARAIYVAALAVAPDAHDEVMKVYYALVPNSGKTAGDAKGGLDNKDNKMNLGAAETDVGAEVDDIIAPNPLDFPTGIVGANQTGPTLGGQGGFPLIPVGNTPTTIAPTIPPAPISQF